MSESKGVRVRFAPSPTGYLHIGGLRTALFNWLFARHNNGTFLVRIEDTDRERSKPEYTDAILYSLHWMGIESDEPLVFQSQRLADYKKVLDQLIATGKAYRCFCSPEEVIARHKKHMGGDDLYVSYDGFCRKRKVSDEDLQKPFVIRFALPDQKEVSFTDSIRGHIALSLDQLDDFIIARSDGWPMYNFVVVVDDAYMKITHVIRGEEHIPNTVKQILLYQACGYAIPQFAHLPLILGPSGDKLSKRDAATSVIEYRQEGFLPDALFNYLARLGWSHGDQEVFTRQEMIDYFSLKEVGKKGAIFDMQKLLWLNGLYIRQTSEQELCDRLRTDVVPDILDRLVPWNEHKVYAAINVYKERVKTMRELAQELILLHDGPTTFDNEAVAKWVTDATAEQLISVTKTVESCTDFSVEPIKEAIKELAKQLQVKLVVLAQPLRIALVGKDSSPGVFELLVLLGKEESVRRLKDFAAFLEKRASKK